MTKEEFESLKVGEKVKIRNKYGDYFGLVEEINKDKVKVFLDKPMPIRTLAYTEADEPDDTIVFFLQTRALMIAQECHYKYLERITDDSETSAP